VEESAAGVDDPQKLIEGMLAAEPSAVSPDSSRQ